MTTLSKEEYLKRYLNPVEGGDYKKRKKKKKEKVKQSRGMKIVDDDVSWSNIAPKNDDFPDDLLTNEEKPQIEVIDNRTKEEKAMDEYRKNSKWKMMDGDEDEDGGRDDKGAAASDSDFDDIPRRGTARHDSDSDMDVPRQSKKRHDSESNSDDPRQSSKSSKVKEKNKRYDSDSDLDVKRTQKRGKVKNEQRRRHDSSSSDLDVKRSRNGMVKGQRSRHDSNSDLDIPRSKTTRKSDSNQRDYKAIEKQKKRYTEKKHKEGRKKRHDSSSDSDLDLSRSKGKGQKSNNRKEYSNSDINMSRTRKTRHNSSSDSDLNLPRSKGTSRSNVGQITRKRHDSTDSDIDVPRARKSRHDSDSDLEIPRQKEKGVNAGKHGENKKKSQMSSGGTGGLTSRHELKKEIEERVKRESDIDRLATESRKSATVYREKGGKKRDFEKEREVKQAEDQEKQKKIDKYDKWGKGLAQGEMRDYAIEDLIHEANKPLARYRDDADLDAFQRSQIRDGDPMAEYISKKKKKEAGNVPSMPKYRGPAPPPNRYQMQPGYRWDGVDRSNGFEKKFYMKQSERSAQRQEAYKWSVEDM